MEPQFYVTGNNIPPEGDIQKMLRYTNGEWKEIESSDTNSAKE